ncbi:MAG: ATP-binding protein [Candidatus Margulisiibacteriota bacterium]
MALTLLVFGLLAAPRIKASTSNLVSAELYRQAALSSGSFVSILSGGDALALQKKAVALSKISDSRITVLDARGKVLADSLVMRRRSASLDRALVLVEVPLKNSAGKVVGCLRLAVAEDRAASVIVKFYKSLLAAFVFAMIAVIIASGVLAQILGKPVTRLTGIAEKIAEGQFPQVILHRSRFEVGRLEEAVEKMSQKLADNFQKINAQKGQMAAILSGMAEGVLAVDQNGRIILANPAVEKTFGILELDILGKTVREGIRNNEIADLVEEAQRAQHTVEKEISMIMPIQGEFIAHASPIQDRAGNLFGVVAVLYNVTEIRKLERHRSEFVANVSHELKTPLTVIRSAVETLQGGAVDDRAVNRNFLNKIQKHSDNLSALIDDILEISRLEAKKELGPFVRLDLEMLVNRALDTVAESAKQKNIIIEKHCDGGEKSISGIEDHVYRAIVNLLNNAINYNKAGGRVDIYCNKTDNKIVVKIIDKGIGIAERHLSRIFERFYRTDAARSRELGGTGLGLAIVKHVMNIHGGSVTVESVEGEGSTFTLVFTAAG